MVEGSKDLMCHMTSSSKCFMVIGMNAMGQLLKHDNYNFFGTDMMVDVLKNVGKTVLLKDTVCCHWKHLPADLQILWTLPGMLTLHWLCIEFSSHLLWLDEAPGHCEWLWSSTPPCCSAYFVHLSQNGRCCPDCDDLDAMPHALCVTAIRVASQIAQDNLDNLNLCSHSRLVTSFESVISAPQQCTYLWSHPWILIISGNETSHYENCWSV